MAAMPAHFPALQHQGPQSAFGNVGMDHFTTARQSAAMSALLPSPSAAQKGHAAAPYSLPPQAVSQGAARAASGPSKHADLSESEDTDSHKETRGNINTIFPRRKQGQHARTNSQPVVMNEATLSQLFTLPLHKAAIQLGISATAMKSACRKLGIKKWPYRALSLASTAKVQRKVYENTSRKCSSPSTQST